MKNTLLTALIAAALTGCALTPEDIARIPDQQLCDLHGTLARSPLHANEAATLLQEIVQRRLVTEEERGLINQKIVQTGMSECAMLSAWGSPDRQNTTLTAGLTSIQHVYRRGGLCAQYVYTTNGVVKSIQTSGC